MAKRSVNQETPIYEAVDRGGSLARGLGKSGSKLRSGRYRAQLTAFSLLTLTAVIVLLSAPWAKEQSTSAMTVGSPTVDANGVKYYPVRSVYQGFQPQIIRVLEPTHPASGKPRRILFVLPVDAGVDNTASTWSDGLEELRLLNVQDRFNMTLVAPSFSYEPWYGDNDRDPRFRMESFIIHDLVPFSDTFAKGSVPQRYLIGFSKSGNGALILILKHPDIFNGAAAWDAPAQLSDIDAQGVSSPGALSTNFGTQANFNRYNIPLLISTNAEQFRTHSRLWISGDEAAWTADMSKLNNQLTAAGIPHSWTRGGSRAHSWNSGWLNDAVADLDAHVTFTTQNTELHR